MPANRNYSSVARATTLTTTVSGSATTFAVTDVTGFPSVPFTLVADAGRATEEIVTVTSQVGLSLTVIRGEDGSAAQPHDAGATVRHMATARDLREPQEHIATTTAHGIVGDVVGTGDQQVLDNKTFTPIVTDHTPVVFQVATGQTAPMVQFLDPFGVSLGYIDTAARIHGAGIVSTQPNVFTAGGPSVTPLTVQGATSQSAHLLSMTNDVNLELSFIDAGGKYQGSGITSTHRSVFQQDVDNVVPLSIYTRATGTNRALQIISSTSFDVAGITGEVDGFQLYHGGSATANPTFLPFKMHAGTVTVTMLNGATSQGGTIDLSPYGFTQAPIMTLTARQDNVSTLQRRVTANIENAPTTTACTYRVVQTSNEVMPSNTSYTVHWVALQMMPGSAAA